MFQISDHLGDLFETAFYLRGICETCSNSLPNPCYACRHCELILQMHNHRRIVVGVEERHTQVSHCRLGATAIKSKRKTSKSSACRDFVGDDFWWTISKSFRRARPLYRSRWRLKLFRLRPAKSSRRLSSPAVLPLLRAASVPGQMLRVFRLKPERFRNAWE